MKIAVIGLGKIGLPLAVQFAMSGHSVVGADRNQVVVQQVNQGSEPFPGEAELSTRLLTVVQEGRLVAITDTAAAVAQANAVVVVVPLFVTGEDQPDFGWLDSATRDIGRGLQSDTLVIYETTLPVGTTRGRWKPLLEKTSGLREGIDFHLSFSPERVLTGRVFADLRKYPKLVGGLSAEGARRTVEFYYDVIEFDERPDLARGNGVWDLGTAEAAEMAKLVETTYRDVNIGLANQFAMYATGHGVNVYEVIEATNSQPYSHVHQPGIAVGGHCIPVYPRLYLWNDPSATIVRAARAINAGMPAYAVQLAKEHYGDLTATRVVVLGASYRGGVKETAYSGVFATVEALRLEGANATVHDPMYSDKELEALGLSPHNLGDPVDIAILHTAHKEYEKLGTSDLPGLTLMIDGRNVVDRAEFGDASVVSIGRPGGR
ncbi:nucleotide sugar dehydrogenase [Nakamurella sp. GG22]